MSIRYTHTNIVASDWKALSAFYQTVFDCIPVPPERDLSGTWLDQGTGVVNAQLKGIHLRLPGFGEGGPTLEIYQYHEVEENLTPVANRKGLGHLAFHVDDVRHIHDKVLLQGGKKLGEITINAVDGVGLLTFVYMADPEGNLIEIQNWS